MGNKMYIDTHMHLAYPRFEGQFKCISPKMTDSAEYARTQADDTLFELVLDECTRPELIRRLKEQGMEYGIENAIGFDSYERIIQLAKAEPEFVKVVLGLHPNVAAVTPISERTKIDAGIESYPETIAVGEVGLEYHHHPKGKRHYFRQWFYFVYQIKLADRLGLPLVLHIRNAENDNLADKHALRILKRYKKLLHGGVVHCFNSNLEYAKEYIELGFYLGIGGSLLQQGGRGDRLREVIASKDIPLDKLITETDSPFILPEQSFLHSDEKVSGKQYRKVRNTPAIIPEIMRQIAALKGISYGEVIEKMHENAKAALSLKH